MTSTSLNDPIRSLLWLAVAAFLVGFAGFLAVDRATHPASALGVQQAPSLAASGLSGEA